MRTIAWVESSQVKRAGLLAAVLNRNGEPPEFGDCIARWGTVNCGRMQPMEVLILAREEDFMKGNKFDLIRDSKAFKLFRKAGLNTCKTHEIQGVVAAALMDFLEEIKPSEQVSKELCFEIFCQKFSDIQALKTKRRPFYISDFRPLYRIQLDRLQKTSLVSKWDPVLKRSVEQTELEAEPLLGELSRLAPCSQEKSFFMRLAVGGTAAALTYAVCAWAFDVFNNSPQTETIHSVPDNDLLCPSDGFLDTERAQAISETKVNNFWRVVDHATTRGIINPGINVSRLPVTELLSTEDRRRVAMFRKGIDQLQQMNLAPENKYELQEQSRALAETLSDIVSSRGIDLPSLALSDDECKHVFWKTKEQIYENPVAPRIPESGKVVCPAAGTYYGQIQPQCWYFGDEHSAPFREVYLSVTKVINGTLSQCGVYFDSPDEKQQARHHRIMGTIPPPTPLLLPLPDDQNDFWRPEKDLGRLAEVFDMDLRCSGVCSELPNAPNCSYENTLPLHNSCSCDYSHAECLAAHPDHPTVLMHIGAESVGGSMRHVFNGAFHEKAKQCIWRCLKYNPAKYNYQYHDPLV
ncbi:hypothetical protein GNI_120470 [Gregarina niphandrodes]|uniref:Uncharacterized protein n=1 Tax=Gregarina niphandrodes TaxID=110365 RepID=A0A023B2G8_GRENI|nr:hypothetical protein GNI_120470 [Gregarina niphandrodes]EZG54500.1 hypothetical protein GNI_120470 [Gregarina niphandrodes]|eukprot:XP_011131837.1 hypothetical protein GNI_120470 [Gregarina niphandrodes]